MLAARATRPKLTLAVPTASTASSASIASLTVKASLPRSPISPSPISPTIQNTRLNQRGFSSLQPPTFAYSQPSNTKSILKRGQTSKSSPGKKLSFMEEPTVRCITPVPADYHMTRDERRWGKSA